MKTALVILGSAMVLAACAGSYNPQYRINEVQIVNNSDQAVSDVSIRAAGRVFSCDNIVPFGFCSDRFPKRNYAGETIEIEWTFGNGAPQSESLQVAVPATFMTGLPLRGVLEVDPQGGIDAHFEQETRAR